MTDASLNWRYVLQIWESSVHLLLPIFGRDEPAIIQWAYMYTTRKLLCTKEREGRWGEGGVGTAK